MLLYISNHRRSFIQVLIIQMAHIVNNHIIMAFYIDCIHTDICEQSVITRWLSAIQMVIIQIQAIPHKTRKHIWKMFKKKWLFVQKRSLSYAPIRWQVHHSVTRERQNSNKQSSVYLWLFWMISFCLGHYLLQNHAVFFYHQDAVFERNLFHNGHKQ